MICTSCAAGKIEKRRVPYNFLGEKIGLFDALVCDKCDETLFEPEAADKIEEEVRKKGLWGLRARTKISKVGNALDVRIPKTLADFLSLKKGQEVIIEPIDKGRLQIIVE
ncbi:MAG: hypothetical protein AABX47_03835 [Nanoarchaeota archaeon]